MDTCIEISVILRQLEGTLSEQTIPTARELCVHTYKRTGECKNCNAMLCLMPAYTSQTLISCPIDLTEHASLLAENTDTACGDCLKLETSVLSSVFFCCGNHLAVGTSRSLASAPCPFQTPLRGFLKSHKVEISGLSVQTRAFAISSKACFSFFLGGGGLHESPFLFQG